MDIGGLGSGLRIDDCERAVAVTDEHTIARGVHLHIVGIVAELDAADRRQIVAAQHPHRAVAAIRHKDAVGGGDVRNTLRLAEAGDCAHLNGRQIDDPQAVVAELGDKQPLAFRIDPQMIDPAADLAQRDLRLEQTGGPTVCAMAVMTVTASIKTAADKIARAKWRYPSTATSAAGPPIAACSS